MKDLLTKKDLTEVAMVDALATTIEQLPDVAQSGREMSRGMKNVYLISCGGGLHINEAIQWWCDVYGSQIQYRTFSSADFLSVQPENAFGEDALIILSSKSGSTQETLAVAAALQDRPCKKVVFTQSAASALNRYAEKSFYTGDTSQSFHAMLMLIQAFVGGVWAERENWKYLDELVASLSNLPSTLASAALLARERADGLDVNFDKNGTVYFIASGPMEFTSKAFGLCLLEEMLEVNVNAYPANHFYHSLVEKMPLKPGDRVILLLGLDGSRWQVEQVQNFFYGKGFLVEVCDAREQPMGGIHQPIQPLLAPIIVEAALKPAVELLAAMTKDPDQRKYMGKEDFWKGCNMIESHLNR